MPIKQITLAAHTAACVQVPVRSCVLDYHLLAGAHANPNLGLSETPGSLGELNCGSGICEL